MNLIPKNAMTEKQKASLLNANFSTIAQAFRSGPVPKERLSYKALGAMLKALTPCCDRREYFKFHEECTSAVFDIPELSIHYTNQIRDTETLFSLIIPAMASQSPVSIESVDEYLDIPDDLRGKVRIIPLAGVNLAAIDNHNDSGSNGKIADKYKWYMAWGNLTNQRNDSFTIFIDTETNAIHAYPSPQGSVYENILNIFSYTFPVHVWGSSAARNHFLHKAIPSKIISHAPMPFPIHYGHYVQNNLAHISRLEEIGLTSYFDTIYRPCDRSDFLAPKEESLFFTDDTKPKLKYTTTLDDAIQESKAKKSELLIISKAATLSSYTSKVFRASLAQQNPQEDNPLSSDKENHLKLCIGLRGGTREALNLIVVIQQTVEILYSKTGRQIALLADGMSKSNLNNRDTTRFLSMDLEIEQASNLSNLYELESVASFESVVGKPMFEQISKIAQCDVAISHFGSSFFKYMTMCGIPTIVHGERPSFYDKYVGEATPNYFIGPDFIEELIHYSDPKRNSYRLNVCKSANEIANIILENIYEQDS